MGRFTVKLDPSGYKYCSEPGLCFLIDGRTLLGKFVPDATSTARPSTNFYLAPGSEWLMCKPVQFRAEPYRDGVDTDTYALADYVLRAEKWLFSTAATATEWEPTRVPSTTYPDNQWISLVVPEDAVTLDVTDYDAIATAAGITLPDDLITAGICSTTPGGFDFGINATQVTPYFSWLNAPPPDDVFIFGFAQICVVVSQGVFYVLRTPDGTKTNWELLGKGQLKGSSQPFVGGPARGSGSLLQSVSVRAEVQSLLALTAGYTDLFLLSSESEGHGFPLRKDKPAADDTTPLLGDGGFWVACAKGKRLAFQAQIVGYAAADSTELNTPNPLVWIDLSEEYKPSVAPVFASDAFIKSVPGGVDNTYSTGTSSVTFNNTDTGTAISYGLLDELGLPWDTSGATVYKGSLFLTLLPGFRDTESGKFLSPQVRLIEFRFPPVLTDRDSATLTLTDEQFSGVEAEVSLYDPADKRVRIDLFDAGVELLSASGIDLRDNFPVEVWEDTDDDDVADTKRVAGWVQDFELKELKCPVSGHPTGLYRLEAKGLMCRMERQWEYLPQLCNPSADPAGTIEHTFAVKECLLQSGFDVDDTDVYVAQTDAYAGTDFAQLKGTWGLTSGSVGRPVGNKWGPSWKDTRLDYAQRIAHDVRGWVLYEELDGTIRYHEDLQRELQRGGFYTVSATLYQATANAAGASVPQQKYLAAATRSTQKPEANVIRINANDESDTLTPQMLIRDRLSVSDRTYPHFLGEPVVYSDSPKEVDNTGDMRVLGWLLLEKIGRRSHRWQFEAPLAGWECEPEELALGHVLTAEGKGDWEIVHQHWELLSSRATGGRSQSRFTVLSLPTGAQEGAGGGAYPGQGTDPAEA